MSRTRKKKLSPANLEIMKVVWDKDEVTVSQVMKVINASRTSRLRRTTIQVQMNRLEEYGWLTHRQEGRTYYYTAAAGEQKTKKAILKDIKERVFGGSRTELIRCLLDDGEVTEDEIIALRRLIENTEGEER
jgi:predicted transcriptional regulator